MSAIYSLVEIIVKFLLEVTLSLMVDSGLYSLFIRLNLQNKVTVIDYFFTKPTLTKDCKTLGLNIH